jgi:hypothetical protein
MLLGRTWAMRPSDLEPFELEPIMVPFLSPSCPLRASSLRSPYRLSPGGIKGSGREVSALDRALTGSPGSVSGCICRNPRGDHVWFEVAIVVLMGKGMIVSLRFQLSLVRVRSSSVAPNPFLFHDYAFTPLLVSFVPGSRSGENRKGI